MLQEMSCGRLPASTMMGEGFQVFNSMEFTVIQSPFYSLKIKFTLISLVTGNLDFCSYEAMILYKGCQGGAFLF